ncbi:CLUMA_CG021385, isoform A [Clunio marinus]|uniref:CLUMA_CG021385, isoform A n=1 Tax=Clunio marinus TaxID=568069 RepID=A0A1J1J9Q4_9DIPT|nr:CLUMA_CG021385, isoform A [Clunio marinus]
MITKPDFNYGLNLSAHMLNENGGEELQLQCCVGSEEEWKLFSDNNFNQNSSKINYHNKHFLKNKIYDKETRIQGKVVVITGGNSGIGKETAVNLAKRGGKIYIGCRDNIKGEKALKEIKKRSGNKNVFLLNLDLASVESIREFSNKFHEAESKLHILINNAGVMGCPKSKTKDGFETHFGTNYLGHFLLTNLLLDIMKQSIPSRIIFVSATAHKFGILNKEDLMSDNSYSRFKAYCQSKLAINLFAYELSKRIVGTRITVNIADPGIVVTDIWRHYVKPDWLKSILQSILRKFLNTPKEGSQTSLRLAVDKNLERISGKYYKSCKEIEPSVDSRNEELSCWLWKRSAELIESLKVVLITGANTGIGRETAIDLARRGGKVYIACRDMEKSEQALEVIRKESQSSETFLLNLDLASIESIRKFSKNFHEIESKLHILINNAGVMACPKSYTKDGFEMQIGVNHLGHFLLTQLLLDRLKASAPSRIVVVSSSGHKLSDINKLDLMSDKAYNKIKAYGQSKLANILFTRYLAMKLEGSGVTVNSCHPGIVQTDLGRHMESWLRPIYRKILFPYYKSIKEGAQTQIRLAVDPDLEHVTGKYFVDCHEVEPSKAALNDETAAWLWKKSTEMIYVKYKQLEKMHLIKY